MVGVWYGTMLQSRQWQENGGGRIKPHQAGKKELNTFKATGQYGPQPGEMLGLETRQTT